MTKRRIVPLLVLTVAMGACASTDESSDDGGETTTSVVSTTTTTATTTVLVAPGPPYEFEVVTDVPYQDPHPPSNSPLVDIYTPTRDGSMPVAVLFHPFSVHNDKSRMSELAEDLAEVGVVVFNVSYGSKTTGEYLRISELQGTCSYWYVAQNAAAHGGDRDDITLVGFSGGANTAMEFAMFAANEATGCFAEKVAIEPSALVLFEGDWLLQPVWDESIREDPTMYDDYSVWGHIDSYAGYPVHLVVDEATRGVYSYSISSTRTDEYLALRDPDGSKRADLEELGALDDGALDVVEFSELFHLRLQRAGHPTTLTSVESSLAHSMTDDVRAAIVDLVIGERDG